MISRYSRKELTQIWSEENKYKIWLNIEIAAAKAMEKYKIIPKGVSSIVKTKAKIKVKRIHEKTSSIPEGLELLMLVHPKKIPERLLYMIDQFVLKGGKLLVFIDPNSETEMRWICTECSFTNYPSRSICKGCSAAK